MYNVLLQATRNDPSLAGTLLRKRYVSYLQGGQQVLKMAGNRRGTIIGPAWVDKKKFFRAG
jgi:hypothetical protein